jgi:hypothetical protein
MVAIATIFHYNINMNSSIGKYLIPFGIVIVLLNIGLILILLFQDFIIPKNVEDKVDQIEQELGLVSTPLSSPVSAP